MENNSRQQWFIDRIGKRVYRNENGCECKTCEIVKKKGVIIKNEMHALYIYDVEGETNLHGIPLKYFDTREEVKDYELKLKE